MKHFVILSVLAVLLLAPVFVFAQQNVGISTYHAQCQCYPGYQQQQ
ncbi:MAG: hypothetical protein IPH36_22655 [Saprospiraceae bacterium]|nr:hypothetical protein [Saprospiraceae bacterium]